MIDYKNLSSYQDPKGQLKDRLAPRVKDRMKFIYWREVKDRTVLDIGCNNGDFVREAMKHGAKMAVGVDKSSCIIGARALAAEEGVRAEFWQVDVDSPEFRQFCPTFDIVFLFSVITHLKDKEEFLDWLDSRIKGVLYFESNHGESNKKHIELVKKHIYCREIKYLGPTDVPEKPHYMWRCKRAGHGVRYNLEAHPLKWIAIDKIQNEIWESKSTINEFHGYDFDSAEYKRLEEDVKKRGIREPLIVKGKKGGFYKGLQGSHRYHIAKKLGYKDLPCRVI